MYCESSNNKSAGPPSLIDPATCPDVEFSRVVAGFLVTATNASIGERPNLCVARLPTKGMDKVLQLGLKSVAKEKGQLFSIHCLNGVSRSCPRM